MRRIALALLLLIFGCLTCEVGTRLWITTHPDPDYRNALSPAYAGAPYWSDEFRSALLDPAWRMGCWYEDTYTYHSKYFNSGEHCERQVVNPPSHAAHTLWIFGNSTLYSHELPDSETISSHLQELLSDWRVRNMATSGAPLSVLRDMIEDQPIQSGDMVVTLTGVGDAASMYNAIRKLPGNEWNEQLCRILNTQRDTLYSVRPLCDWQLRYTPDSFLREDVVSLYAADMQDRYRDSVTAIRRFATEHGARYINVLQPHLWSRPLTEADRQIEAEAPAILPRMGEIFIRAYPLLQPYADLDLTHVLDTVRDEQVVLFDGWHPNSAACKIIARAIATAVR